MNAVTWAVIEMAPRASDWGAIATNTVSDLILMLMFSGALVLWFVVFSYLLSSMESFTVYNPAMSFFIFVIALAVAFNAKNIVDFVMSKGTVTTAGNTVFGAVFGKELSIKVIKPLIELVGYWILILSPLLIALPNGVSAMSELARFQIGRMNAAGAITAMATATIFIIGLPTFHGKIQQLVSVIPDFVEVVKNIFG